MGYDKRIRKLQETINENNKTITERTKDKDTLISCQSGINNTLSLFFSLIPYFTLFGTMSFLYGNGNISIPTELSASIIVGGSLAATAVSKKILTKKSRKKLQREYGKYSGYTESKNLEETIRLLIEIEKLKNKNKVLETTIDKLNEQKKQEEGTAKWAEQLQAKIKETVSEDSEKYRKEIQRLKEELDEKYKKLYAMTAKKELNRYSKSKSTFKKSLIVAGLLTFYAIAPLSLKFTPGFNEVRTHLQTLITVLAPFTISAAACALYMKKQNAYLETVLNNLKCELLSNQEDDEEPTDNKSLSKQEIKKEEKTIEELIKEISQKEFELREQKSMLEVVEENKKPKYEYKFDENQPKLYYEQQLCEIVEEKGDQYTLRIPQKRL